jgi:hypothetical protein
LSNIGEDFVHFNLIFLHLGDITFDSFENFVQVGKLASVVKLEQGELDNDLSKSDISESKVTIEDIGSILIS